MESNKRPQRAPNPVESANIFSKITYLFVFPLLRKGEICEQDIYDTTQDWTSTTLGNKLEREWKKEQKNRNPWLVRSLLRVFGVRMLLVGLVVVVINSISLVLRPLMVGRIVQFFDPTKTELTTQLGLMYCGALMLFLIVSSLIEQFFTYQVDLLVLKIKIACASLIYRKLTKVTDSVIARGQAVTLITKDLTSSELLLFAIYQLVVGVLMIFVLGYIMFTQIGIPALIALSWLLIYLPLQVIFGKTAAWFRLRTAAITDKRLKVMQETLTAVRIIKMFAWESFFIKTIGKIRRKELSSIRAFYSIEATAFNLGNLSVSVMIYIAIATCISFGQNLSADKIFVVLSCIRSLSGLLRVYGPLSMGQFGNFIAGVRRFSEFSAIPEVPKEAVAKSIPPGPPKVTVQGLTVILGNIRILNDVTLRIKNGLAMLKGPIGSGKTTLLHSLIGEIEKSKGSVEVLGTVSYASQEPWLFPGTVRQNILFGERYDSKRYERVIQVCGLKKDLQLFSNGDGTYLTDRGLNLSRGQKTRINLARCVYRNVDIYLLDDCLSALDSRVSRQIFYECIKGFLKGRICLLATHNQEYMHEFDHIFILNEGSLLHVSKNPFVCNSDAKNYYETPQSGTSDTESEILGIDNGEDEINDCSESDNLLGGVTSAKNIYEECNDQGNVTKKVYYYYFSSGGGILIFLLILVLLIATQALGSWSDYFVGMWIDAEQKLSNLTVYQNATSSEFENLGEISSNKLLQYTAIVGAAVATGFISYISFVCFSYTASANIHRQVLSKIFNAAIVFFDKNLSGSILNRFSRDVMILDEWLPNNVLHFLQLALFILATLCVISLVKPFLAIPSALLLIILYIARRFYLRTGRSIRRLEGSTRSPVIGHLNATVDGLTTIRSSVMTSVVTREFEGHLDLYNSVMFMSLSTTRAFGLILEMLCIAYVSAITFAMMLLRNGFFSGEVGLAITQSLTLSGVLLQFGVRQWAEIENRMTSTERIMAYTKIDTESEDGEEPSDWPNKGKIVYTNVTLKYPSTGDLVLKNITFTINSKEKVGIVGRTGAGKTSLISVLYRLYEYDGSVYIDGIRTNDTNLQCLRSKISIIPQDPFLFTGTIRDNLDPYNEYSDHQLWEALGQVEMRALADNLYEEISEGGSNFSIGQKQLICLARAILCKNVILVLDEATASLDLNTDSLIQRTIAKNFADCTVITIAHRIQTILGSDKVLVMDEGQVVEYGNPEVLLNNINGRFYAIVNDAGLLF